MSIRAFVFDAYGTLFDVHAAIARHHDSVGPDAGRLSEIWRSKQLEYSWTLTLAGRYVDFWILTQRALDYALARLPSVDQQVRARLLEAYFQLDAYPDARETLEQIKSRGKGTAILSNGSRQMLEAAVNAAGLRPCLDAVLSVDAIGIYKPRPEVYAMTTEALRLRADEMAFVSSNRWDVMGAALAGFQTIWINRGGLPDEYADHPAAAVMPDLGGVPSLAV